MNKNICLIAIACLLVSTLAFETPSVEGNSLSWRQNFMTLFFIQTNLAMCFLGSTFTLFWGNDKGDYLLRCFNNFVAKPKFL